MSAPLLSVENLSVSFRTPDGDVKAVSDLSFSIERGQTLGIVGESGSGKSVSASALMRLLPPSAQLSGRVMFDGKDVLTSSKKELQALRGDRIAMVFQDPMTALDPFHKVGWQLASAYRAHHPKSSKKEARERAIEMMSKVGIPEPGKRVDGFPHEFSGGMRQRIVIALALINDPDLLIADEPTTALDVTVQAQILELMSELQQEFGSAIIMITHDLGVVAGVADDVMVMYAGRAVERATVDELYAQPGHPYTWGLLGAVQSLEVENTGPLKTIPGSPPSLIALPSGCSFNPRCASSDSLGQICRIERPLLADVSEGHSVACHLGRQ